MNFYLSTLPTFGELADKAQLIDNTPNLQDKHIAIISMETGEILAIRHAGNLWEFCYYISVKDDRYYALEKKYKRGLISYGHFLELIKG